MSELKQKGHKPSRAEPSQAEPSRAEPSRAKSISEQAHATKKPNREVRVSKD